MSRKSTLFYALMSLGAIGAVVIAFTFIVSLNPSARTAANLPRIEIPDMAPRSFKYVKNPRSDKRWPSLVLVVRQANGDYNFWYVPTIDGITALPDNHWWTPGYMCRNLSPDFSIGRIYCKDTDMTDWAKFSFQWSLDGQSLSNSSWVPDLEALPGKEELGDFVLYHFGNE